MLHYLVMYGATSFDVGVVMGAVAAIMAGFGALVKFLVTRFDSLSERQESSFKEAVHTLSGGLKDMRDADKDYQTEVLQKIQTANEQREYVNGKIGDSFDKLTDLIQQNTEKVLANSIHTQHVEHQHVAKEVVENKE